MAMHKQRLVATTGASLAIVSTILPWVSIGPIGASGTDTAAGKIAMALGAVALVVALVGNRQAPLHVAARGAMALLGVGLAAMGVMNHFEVADAIAEMSRAGGDGGLVNDMIGGIGGISVGFGVYVCFAAALACIATIAIKSATPPSVATPPSA